MPRREPQQEFNPKADFIVRRPFKAGGRLLPRGERFNPNRDALSMRRVRQLFDWRFIQYASSPKPEKVEAKTVSEPEPETIMGSSDPIAEEGLEPQSTSDEALESLTKAELVEKAKEQGISYAAQKNKSELLEILQG